MRCLYVFVLMAFFVGTSFGEPRHEYAHQTLIVAYEPDLAPLNAAQEGVPAGFAIEVLDRIAALHHIRLQYVPMARSRAIEAIREQQVDIIVSIPFSRSYAELMDFSEPFYSTSVGILTPADRHGIDAVTDLSETLVALQSHTIEYDFLKNIRRIHYQVAGSQRAAIEAFLLGRADVFVGDVAIAEHYLEQHHLEDRYSFARTYLMPLDYSFAVSKDNYRLLHTLNSGIRHVKSTGEYGDMYQKWFKTPQEFASGTLLVVVKITLALIAVFLILFLVGARWNRQLKKEVDRKTRDLSHLNASLVEQVELTRNNVEFLRQIIDSSPRGIVTLNREGLITKFNQKASVIVGLRELPLGEHYSRVQLISELLKNKADEVLSGRKNYYLGETKEWERDPETLYQLRYYVYPLFSFEQHINGLILTFEDVTEETELRKKLFEQEKSKALSRVVAGIAHEIRNPLSSIKTFVELIPTKLHNERFQKEISTYVPREITRVNQLIEGLINYARPRQQIFETIAASTILDECYILFERSVMNKGFALLRDYQSHRQICVDHNQIKQVVINFLINALDALEEKRLKSDEPLHITLRTRDKADRVCIQIVDDGIGMDEDGRVKALEPFFTTKPKGTGLGIPIADQLIKENRGELHISSNQKFGTVISVYFDSAL
ncbi:PAS sensor protein [Desulfurispirillum indicum S5]|uniref:histidine kinase n=1 Tax=Desulfurispirillum indicum (strain ATCC BAA-1389 / DSM 22839 / S5) TaxID=653733 RepID=E6W4D3_DESIS|nr:transporter substrate-binding domain-containing protein [Desulfurispirillum indicum]ADU65907.1 PAS sensor protein [Desulfurispirillum indicum S5]